MLRELITIKVTHDVLVPTWIAGFGLVVLAAPAVGVAASLGLFVAGVGLLPAAVLIEGALRDRRQVVRIRGVQ